MREPGIFVTSPESDSRESAMQSISPAFIAASAASTPATVTKVAFGAVRWAARNVAVFTTPPMRTPGTFASSTFVSFESGATRYVLCRR
jgi:hypothetical protein